MTTSPDQAEQALSGQSMARRMATSLRHDIPALISISLLLILALAAILAPVLAPHNPLQTFPDGLTADGSPVAPGGSFPLGTDPNGRDVFSRLLFGARVSLTIGLLANGLATVIGVTIGMCAGYLGGWVETGLMRITDIVMSFPILLLCIALIAVTGPSARNVVLVIAFIYWTTLARVIRSLVISLKEREFVVAARTLGLSHWRIMRKHIIPHLVPTIIVYATLGVASSILIEASLSFLGVGVPIPNASWGQMIEQGRDYYATAPWLLLFPGFALVLTVLSFNLAGDWLRDVLDPTVSERR